MTPAELIREYIVAYEAANSSHTPSDISYERGWFIFRPIVVRFRRKEFEKMIMRLKLRVETEKMP